MKKRSWWLLGLGFLGVVAGAAILKVGIGRKKTEQERNREILNSLERVPTSHILKITIERSNHEGQP